MMRRHFFRSLLAEGTSFCEEVSGRPQLRLAELWRLPDAVLFSMRPAYDAGVTVFEVEGRMCGRRGDGPIEDLFAVAEPGTYVLCRFDGLSTVGQVADELAAAWHWPSEDARTTAKDVFLRLVRLGLCRPARPLETDAPNIRNELCSSQGDGHE